ncbi:hypothetical protein N332_01870, partial [Mesitornis unicolor]
RAAESIYAGATCHLHMSKKKISNCVNTTARVIAWALTEGKDFDFVFKNFGILECRGRRVVFRFFEDLLRNMDRSRILAKAFLQV